MSKRTLLHLVGIVVLLSGICGLAPCRAGAQRTTQSNNEVGRKHFDRGVDYYRDGNINAAFIEFKRAYEASPNYRVLYNLGQVANALNNYVEAQRYFQQYLDDGGSDITPERSAEVRAVISKLGGRIALIRVRTNVDGAQIFIDDVAVGSTPLKEPLRVSAGTRRLSAAARGRPRTTRVIEAVGGEALTVELELAPMPAPQPAATPTIVYREPTPTSGVSASVWLGIATGALAVGTGVVGYLAAQDSAKFHDALDRATTTSEVNRLHDRAATKALVTDILLGATAVTGAITLFVALKGDGRRETPTRSARARLGVGLGSVQLTGQL